MYPASQFKDANSLLPLLWDRVNTLDMQVHTMNLKIKATSALNPGQTPVDVPDCPSMLSQRRPNFDFLSIFRTILRCLEGYILSNAYWLLMAN